MKQATLNAIKGSACRKTSRGVGAVLFGHCRWPLSRERDKLTAYGNIFRNDWAALNSKKMVFALRP